MITTEILKELVAPNIEGINNPNQQIITGEGVDGIIAMIQNELTHFPVLVVENDKACTMRCLAGGFITYGQSLWVMDYFERDEDKERGLRKMFELTKKIIAIMRYYSRERQEFHAIDWEDVAVFQREGGSNFWGYEIMFNLREDINLRWLPTT